ncbi:VOC family protein [Aquamicrobium sp. LC103]|uniref:VOC family protein n=1 Tax=Aquamicrobium sp. LC103 TaxID=1120658 RepID=UPI00063E82A8|nr:VOC family protein [Aquamicrobium sp. LC103]
MSELVVGTNHVGFTVSDLQRSVSMFRDLFGYDLVSLAPREPGNVALLTGIEGADIMVAHLRKPGLVGVELISYLGPNDRSRLDARPCDTGFAHLTYDVSDIGAMVEKAASFELNPLGGMIVSTAGPNVGARAVYLRDPDGISIELIQPARFA